MPEMHFYIEWPDGTVTRCYSPSTVIREYFEPGMTLSIAQLLERTTEALDRAGERVRAKYGFDCTMSSAQSAEIRARARAFGPNERAKVSRVLLKADDVPAMGARS